MSRISHTVMVVLCLAALVGVFAGNAAAENICYDFSRVNSDQGLIGQDSWGNATTLETIMVGSGDPGWSGNYAECNTSGSNYIRQNNAGWGYSLQNDLDWEYSVKTNAFSSSSNQTKVGLNKNNGAYTLCLYAYAGQLRWRLDDAGGTALWYPRIAIPDPGHTYQIGVEVTANGAGSYTFKGFYDDLGDTAGRQYYDGSYASDPAAYTTTISDLSSRWDGLYLTLSGTSYNVTHADDICISQVPEPSTLALLVAGLVGLLAYAWRKRK